MKFSQRLKGSIQLPLLFLGLIWLAFLLGFPPVNWGILPQNPEGLKGILFAPFIHGDLNHILSNSAPFFILFSMLLFFYPKIAKPAFTIIFLFSGLLVWIFGRTNYHIGASGLVYGMVAFLFWSGVFRRSIPSIIISLIITFLYSGLWFGVLPNQDGVSWEGHLMGGLVGVFTAYLFRKKESALPEKEKVYSWEEHPAPKKRFFDENPFKERPDDSDSNQTTGWTSNHT